jgi:inosine/xanthosine triphosphate pyrophosphatase family protein
MRTGGLRSCSKCRVPRPDRRFTARWPWRFSGEVRLRMENVPVRSSAGRGSGWLRQFSHPALGRTMAELEMEEKNRLSHRARALTASRPVLAELLSGGGGL